MRLSDDMLVGMICVAIAVKLHLQSISYQRVITDEIKALMMSAIVGKTTDISIKYLVCALEGRFSDVLRELMGAVFSGSVLDWDAGIERVAGIGSTSGIDMLLGIWLGCYCAAGNKRENGIRSLP